MTQATVVDEPVVDETVVDETVTDAEDACQAESENVECE